MDHAPNNASSGDADQGREFARLIHEARAGCIDSVGRLVECCRPYLMLVANRELDPAIRAKLGASDVVQETLLTVQKSIGQFEGTKENELLAWMRGILINDLRENRRKFRSSQKRQVDREISLSADSRIEKPGYEIEAEDRSPRAEAVVNEEIDALRAAVRRLPEHYRQVVQMRNWQQLSFEEIAKELDRSAEAVRKLWSRAVVRLQQELESDGSDKS